MKPPALIRALSIAVLVLTAAAAQCAVRASVDTRSVETDSTVELMLEHDGQTSAEPDLSPIKQDFDILSTSRSSSVQITNGTMTASVRIELSLSPKHGGQIRIPGISWGNETSDPIIVNVSGATQGNPQEPNASSGSGKVFLRISIEPQQSYVQAGVDLSVRLYSAVPLYHAELEVPAGNDVLVHQVGADRNETVVERGERYQVIERRYKLFPQRSGSLKLSGPVLNAQIAVQNRMNPFGNSLNDFFDNLPLGGAFTTTKPLRLHGDDITLNVLPRPAAAGNEYWLPARDVTLEAEWRPNQGQIKAGDPVTLELHLKAYGLTAAQLPDLMTLLKLPDGLKAYPDQATLANDTQGGDLVGYRDQSIALIADRAGDFTIPALALHWWNIKTNTARQAILPARVLSFSPGVIASAPSPPAITAPGNMVSLSNGENRGPIAVAHEAQGANKKWLVVSASLAVLWGVTLIAWYVSRRRTPKPQVPTEDKSEKTAAEARRQFGEACRRNDARAARACLLEWIGASNTYGQPINLRTFGRQVNRPDFGQLLKDLDRACFAGEPWLGAPLLEALNKLPIFRDQTHAPKEELEPLYK